MRLIEQVRQTRSQNKHDYHDSDSPSTVSTAVPSQAPSSASTSSQKVSDAIQRLKMLQLESQRDDNPKVVLSPKLEPSKAGVGENEKPTNRALLPDFAARASLAIHFAPIITTCFSWMLILGAPHIAASAA